MAPSRGPRSAFRVAVLINPRFSRRYSHFVQATTDASNISQIYISRSRNPYLNLSIEHYLLQKTPADANVLFLYTNRPSIVIGRNQNPWVEVNLGLLSSGPLGIDLVRRRSGGGTVFHDEGNVNYCVISPTRSFDRDKHAEMVVRALRSLGVSNARVNERHDIVLGDSREGLGPLKVSGSAYKLTRLRSLHHGTCLLSSPNIESIGSYLRSPARPFIKARGVDSVSSPIANINVPNPDFEHSVAREFGEMYAPQEPIIVADDAIEVPEIRKGLEELTSLDWIYMQTPQFTFSTYPTAEDPRVRPSLERELEGLRANFTARNGSVTAATFDSGDTLQLKDKEINESLINRKIHEIETWTALLPSLQVGRYMDYLFGKNGNVNDTEKGPHRL